VGRPIQRSRVVMYNAACAVSFLALRVDTPAEERSCGRTLAEDLAWSREAIERALPELGAAVAGHGGASPTDGSRQGRATER